MKWIIFALTLCFVCATAIAASTPKPPSKFEQKVLDELKKFKEQMKTGVANASIPPMDPFVLPEINLAPLKLGNSVTFKVAKVSNAKVTGLSDFEVAHIKLNVLMMKINLDLTFSHIHINGIYDVDGKAINIIPVYGRGPFKASVHKTLVRINAVLGTKDKKMQIDSLDMHAEIEDLDLSMEGLLGGGSLGQEINSMLQKVASKLARDMVPKLSKMMSEMARKIANEALAKMNVGSLLG